MLDSSTRERIAWQVIRTLVSRFNSFPEDSSTNRNAPFHEAFLNAFTDRFQGKVLDLPFFISLASWFHGLSTTLGQSFFENVGHILSGGEKKSFKNDSGVSPKVTNKQKDIIADIITDLKNGNERPSLMTEDALLREASTSGNRVEANNFTVDVFFEDETRIAAIELKTVKPNAGEMRGEKQKILEGKSALMLSYPNKDIQYLIGFPFDPTSNTPTGYDKERFLSSIVDGEKYFEPNEVLLAGELWDFLSGGNNTMQQILDIINAIATPEFMDGFNLLNESRNRLSQSEKYKAMLKKWFLTSEIELIGKYESASIELAGKKKRLYWKTIFKDGHYDLSRYITLNE